jgi:hypothetical protein
MIEAPKKLGTVTSHLLITLLLSVSLMREVGVAEAQTSTTVYAPASTIPPVNGGVDYSYAGSGGGRGNWLRNHPGTKAKAKLSDVTRYAKDVEDYIYAVILSAAYDRREVAGASINSVMVARHGLFDRFDVIGQAITDSPSGFSLAFRYGLGRTYATVERGAKSIRRKLIEFKGVLSRAPLEFRDDPEIEKVFGHPQFGKEFKDRFDVLRAAVSTAGVDETPSPQLWDLVYRPQLAALGEYTNVLGQQRESLGIGIGQVLLLGHPSGKPEWQRWGLQWTAAARAVQFDHAGLHRTLGQINWSLALQAPTFARDYAAAPHENASWRVRGGLEGWLYRDRLPMVEDYYGLYAAVRPVHGLEFRYFWRLNGSPRVEGFRITFSGQFDQ